MSETPSADRVSFVTIDEGRDGQRLDNFLITHLKGVPRSRIYRIIRSGEVRVNKKRAKQTTRLANGDIVRIPPIRTAESEAPPKVSDALAERLSRTLIYEDEHLFIFNKPAGLAVHGGSGVSLGLIEALRVLYPEERELELVHRLDRDTSGCIMVARRRSFLRRLQRLMQQGGVEKRYWLLCQGFKGKERRIEAPLLKLMQGNERVVRVSREGKPSVTDFRLLERLGGVSLVEATLGTGRTHQIRVHSQFGGFALLGDDKYGNDQGDRLLGELGMRRLCLHAHSLTFRHPLSERRVRVEAPLDEDFESILAALRRRSRS
ncbi:RluA family pseudouridine synthase [Alloalcanivorax xenomutans]|jgi:23S rRNA pseudouridine955/2504/2580 synthase|uniref:Pseudouridine synthase n=1 Tax=Alloalcanivorax xenomutans TaxID=1094342 RepID=A0A9Q3ZGY3_9GAMM|nr:RluA family pseudouridine synthase [Alloalcanivorax xenomutans]ERS14441.1 23S rRNA pseudouridylate synthase C [Alcanivorax sp. PN-3]PHS62786.1 MAG: RluA family pseudouridine synthase [Alcanivorax sp.]MCE7507962.1 RluA family pseudouridine synthase [Alloalcanivorax xenomutans]MCE7521668.1 RluA family pseudouridine synthase [Alloalcanivorax xenomutans]WOA29900.1 RluA family pseudouridine synthase [Alloalcanivorax xenomutans]|tara:strand:- start:2242 stop:3198 length:957 start_codon:yes stop_codon:yes gene_type:complete